MKNSTRHCHSLCFIIPLLNEEDVLPLLWKRLREVIDTLECNSRVLFVDDGSTDRSVEILDELSLEDARVAYLSFSRNFGHQAALTAGLDYAEGDAVVIMDADLQDPPELVGEMVSLYEEGYDVVYAQRRQRAGETVFKRASAFVFYRLLRVLTGQDIPVDTGDFRLISCAVVDVVKRMPECHRFLRGMVSWTGFSHKALLYDRDERIAGETKYGLFKMLRFAWTAIASFSALPVKAGLILGTAFLFASFLYILRVLYVKFVLHDAVQGWTTIVLLQLFVSGVVFFYLGIVGDYVGRIYEQCKRRPIYALKRKRNVTDSTGASDQ